MIMKYQNKLQENIVAYFNKDSRFFYQGYTGTFFFGTGKIGDEYDGDFLDLDKRHSDKSLAKVRIFIYTDRFETEEVNFKIELYLNSYCEWSTHFEGWVENTDEFKVILKSIGL